MASIEVVFILVFNIMIELWLLWCGVHLLYFVGMLNIMLNILVVDIVVCCEIIIYVYIYIDNEINIISDDYYTRLPNWL